MLSSLPWWTPTALAPLALDLLLVVLLIGYLIYGFRRGLAYHTAAKGPHFIAFPRRKNDNCHLPAL